MFRDSTFSQSSNNKVKVNVRACYSSSYMSQTRDKKRFYNQISEVAADWHELMIP